MSFLIVPVFVMLLRGALAVLILAGAESLCQDYLSARVRRALWILCIFLMLLPQMNFPFQPFAIDMSDFRAGIMSAALKFPLELTNWVRSSEIGAVIVEYSSEIPGLTNYNYPYILGLLIAVVPAVFLLLHSYLRCRKRTARYKKVTDERLLRVWQNITGKARHTPLLLDSGATCHPPVLFGFFRQKLLLPVADMAEYSDSELELLLTHEYIHYRSGDGIINILTLCMWSFGWYNPFFLAARRRLRIACELACDAEVIKCFPDRINEYGKLLLRFANTRKAPEVVIPFGEYSGELRSRIVYIVEMPQRRKSSILLSVALAGILAAPFGLIAAIDSRPPEKVAAAHTELILSLTCGKETIHYETFQLPDYLQITGVPGQPLTAVYTVRDIAAQPAGVLDIKVDPQSGNALRFKAKKHSSAIMIRAINMNADGVLLPDNDGNLILPTDSGITQIFKLESVDLSAYSVQ